MAELAFYDAICENEAAVLELDDDILKTIARELVTAVRESATIDWNLEETVRAAMRARIRRLLNRRGYSPDRQEFAVQLVLDNLPRHGVMMARPCLTQSGHSASGAAESDV